MWVMRTFVKEHHQVTSRIFCIMLFSHCYRRFFLSFFFSFIPRLIWFSSILILDHCVFNASLSAKYHSISNSNCFTTHFYFHSHSLAFASFDHHQQMATQSFWWYFGAGRRKWCDSIHAGKFWRSALFIGDDFISSLLSHSGRQWNRVHRVNTHNTTKHTKECFSSVPREFSNKKKIMYAFSNQ